MRSCLPVLLVSLFVVGCGGSNESYLPKPRPPEPEEAELAPAPAPRTAGAPTPAAPVTANVSAAPALPASGAAAASQPASQSADNAGSPAAPPLSVPDKPPAEMTEAERRQLAVDQLTRIGRALEAFHQKNRCYPNRSFYAGDLSWRVALLPYMGREDLIVEKDEPWTHPTNQKLLYQIPDEFKSLGRKDGKTSFLLLTGKETAYPSTKGPSDDSFHDGLENTILVVQVDDAHAVPWTAPEDYDYSYESVQQVLFNRHKDCCYVLLGGSAGVRRIPANISDQQLLALITPAGHEPDDAVQHTQPPSVDVDTKLIEQIAAKPISRSPPLATPVATIPSAVTPGQPAVAPGGAAPAAAISVSNPVAKLFDAADKAIGEGREHDGLNLYYAAVLASSEADPWKYRMKWFSGLRRPAVALRWGIGVAYTGPTELSKQPGAISTTSATQLVALKPDSQELRTYTGELGDRLLEHLQGMVTNGKSGELLTALIGAADVKQPAYEPRGATPLKPGDVALLSRGVAFVGVGSDRVLTHLANREGVDVLVMFDVQVKPVRNNKPHNTTTIVVKDMFTQEVVFSTSPLNNIRVELARRDPLQEDPVDDVMASLCVLLDERFSATAIPAALSPQHVAGRVVTLSHPRHENPLPALAEIRFYRTQNLISVKQLTDAYVAILGEEQGALLSAGTEREKIQALQRWLPKDAQQSF